MTIEEVKKINIFPIFIWLLQIIRKFTKDEAKCFRYEQPVWRIIELCHNLKGKYLRMIKGNVYQINLIEKNK